MDRICCVCRKTELEGKWTRTVDVTAYSVSHVYCPSCYEDLMDELDRYAMRKWNKPVHRVISAGQI